MSFSCEPLFLKRLMRTDEKFLLLPPLSGRRRKFDPKPRQAVSSPGFLTASFNASASFDAQTERAGLEMCLTVREQTVGWETLLEAELGTDVVVLCSEA